LYCFLLSAFALAGSNALENIIDTGKNADGFTTLLTGVEAANLTDTLSGGGPFTVLAPDDDAFDKLPEGLLECLVKPEQKDVLTKILLYHVLSGNVTSDKVPNGEVQTLNGQNIIFEVDGTDVKVNEKAQVTTADVLASNGVIHVIDNVLVPEDVDLDLLLVECYLNIPTFLATAAAAPDEDDREFTKLYGAIVLAGLTDALSGPGPFTLFAPVDDAFEQIPEDTGKCLGSEQNKGVLADILKYHVVSGKVTSDDLTDGMEVSTLYDKELLKFGVSGTGVTVNDANVVYPNLMTTNGVIHAVDSVLLPDGILEKLECVGPSTAPSTAPSKSASPGYASSPSLLSVIGFSLSLFTLPFFVLE